MGKVRPPANASFKGVGLEARAGKFDSHSRLDWTFGLAVTGAIKARMSQLTTPPRTFVGDELRACMAGTACAVGVEGGEVGRMFFLVVEIGAEFFGSVGRLSIVGFDWPLAHWVPPGRTKYGAS